MIVPPTEDIEIGVTHLSIGGELVRLFKCPLSGCTFRNIHEAEIIRHIRYKEDTKHQAVDVDGLDRRAFIVVKKQKSASGFTYTKKEDLPNDKWPWIRCQWCSYRDKLPRDLQWHFLQKHRGKLYKITDDYDRHVSLEYRLELALDIAKQVSRIEAVSEDESVDLSSCLPSTFEDEAEEEIPTAEELPEQEQEPEEDDESREEEGDREGEIP